MKTPREILTALQSIARNSVTPEEGIQRALQIIADAQRDAVESCSPVSRCDYFAGCALVGSMSSDQAGFEFTGDYNQRAKLCFEYADAMIQARPAYDPPVDTSPPSV